VQSREKLVKYVERVLDSYRQLFNSLESVIQLHGSPSIGEIGQVKNQEEINNEVQAFVETYRQVTCTGDMLVSVENIKRYIVEPVRPYTKLGTLNNHIHAKQNTLILDALELLHRHDEGQPPISPIVVEYNIWCTYLTEKVGLSILKLAICNLVN